MDGIEDNGAVNVDGVVPYALVSDAEARCRWDRSGDSRDSEELMNI
jgi:hypothetical protein